MDVHLLRAYLKLKATISAVLYVNSPLDVKTVLIRYLFPESDFEERELVLHVIPAELKYVLSKLGLESEIYFLISGKTNFPQYPHYIVKTPQVTFNLDLTVNRTENADLDTSSLDLILVKAYPTSHLDLNILRKHYKKLKVKTPSERQIEKLAYTHTLSL